MESVLSNYNIEKPKNFWKIYPTFRTPKIFKDFYTKDKSKEKISSSNTMWAMAHMFDKSECNPYRTMDSEERLDVINDDILNNSSYNWKEKKDLISAMSRTMLTEEERTLHAFELYMEKRRGFIETQQDSITFENIKDLDDAIKRNEFNMKELKRLRDFVDQKSDKTRTRGDIIESAIEKGII